MVATQGPVAQRIRHLTTNQGIAGSSPARIKLFILFRMLLLQMQYNTDILLVNDSICSCTHFILVGLQRNLGRQYMIEGCQYIIT